MTQCHAFLAPERVGHRQHRHGAGRRRLPGRRSPARSAARDTSGRAASWIRTKSGASFASASSPSRTESCRRAPPMMGRRGVRCPWRPGKGTPGPAPITTWTGHAGKGLSGPAQHRLAGQRLILLGPGPAGAFALAGGDDQDGGACHAGVPFAACLTLPEAGFAIFVCR